MQQYFEQKNIINDISSIISNEKIEDKILANIRCDKNWTSKRFIIHNSTFAKMGFKQSKFIDDDLRFNVFIDCYFKQAIFEHVNFTGTIFINCNFDEITIINCIFDYCKFQNCYIPHRFFEKSFPQRANIKWELCKNISTECLKLNKIDEYRKYFFEEKKASEEYYLKKFWHNGNEIYYKKYNFVDKITGLSNFLLSKLNNILWGYGEKISKLIFNITIIILIFSIIYYIDIGIINTHKEMSFIRAIYISLCNFFTASCSYIYKLKTYKIFSIIENIIGNISMGFFIAALFRYINRRE